MTQSFGNSPANQWKTSLRDGARAGSQLLTNHKQIVCPNLSTIKGQHITKYHAKSSPLLMYYYMLHFVSPIYRGNIFISSTLIPHTYSLSTGDAHQSSYVSRLPERWQLPLRSIFLPQSMNRRAGYCTFAPFLPRGTANARKGI
jgi:hypothetical protein